ncbi:MAG: glycosyltransferase family 2 protein [Nitrospira sp.]|nr:MAG: glycosyltransferase family 2 protein [Nitrospira sp.]
MMQEWKPAGLEVPILSVIVPCRNENRHIEVSVRSILSQARPPGGIEVIVADGLSDDGTREILQRLAKEHPELRVVDNPRRVTPCAMNVGILEARGQYIAILGAHCDYAADYLKTCVDLLDEHPEVDCAGGPIISAGRSLFGKAVAVAMSHPVGIGNARHRHPNFEGYAEGACYPVFRKTVFETIGLYDELLVRNQDDELNYRLTKQGGKVYLSPRARSTYFVRETVSSLFRQYFEYGYWRVAVIKKHRMPASFRHLVPLIFLIGLVGSLTLAVIVPEGWRPLMLAGPCVYVLILCCVGLHLSRRAGWKIGFLFPVAAATLHIAYAIGFMWGFLQGAQASNVNQSSTKNTMGAESH